MTLIEQLRAAITEAQNRRNSEVSAATAILDSAAQRAEGQRALSTQEQSAYDGHRTTVRSIDDQLDTDRARLSELEAQETRDAREAALFAQSQQARDRGRGGGRVINEERTYTRRKDSRGEASFFSDAYRMQNLTDMGARQRLERHAQEQAVEGELPARAQTTGGLVGLVPPVYLVDYAAPVLRTGRPLANAVQGAPLPESGMSIIIPRGSTGAAAAAQPTENTAVQNTDEAWLNLTIPVVTIAGQQDVSRQSLERGSPGVDAIIYMDLAAAYHSELDRQVINGTGTGNQMLGILQTAGVAQSTAYGAAITPGLFNLKTAGAVAAIAGFGTRVTPNLIAQNPRRWGWLNGQMDSAGRPLVVPGVGGPMNILALNMEPGGYSADGDPTEDTQVITQGSLQGLPLITDANIPTTVGTNNEDVELVFDRRHAILWEDGDKQPKQLRFEQTLGNQLTVKLVIYGYAAFTAGRYPQGFAKVGGVDSTAGQGQIAPTF